MTETMSPESPEEVTIRAPYQERVPAALHPLFVWGSPIDEKSDEPDALIDYAPRATEFKDHIEALIELLVDEAAWMGAQGEEEPAEENLVSEEELWAPYHAMLILRELAPPEAAEPLLALFDSGDESLIEAMPDVYAGIGAPALPVLQAYVADEDKGVNNRGYVLRIIGAIGETNEELRAPIAEQLLDFLGREDRDSTEQNEFLNGSVIAALCDLHAEAAKASGAPASHPTYIAILEAIQAGVVDDDQIELDDVKIEFGLREPWTDEEREENVRRPRISLLCTACDRARHHQVSVIYYDPELADPENPFTGEPLAEGAHGPLFIPDSITCPRCKAVDQYKLSAKGQSTVAVSGWMSAQQRDEPDMPLPVRFISYASLGFGGHPVEVEAQFRNTLAENPRDPAFFIDYGKFLMFCRRKDLAVHQFSQALQLQDEHPEALFFLARIAEENDQLQEAIEYWHRAKVAAETGRRIPKQLKKGIIREANRRLSIVRQQERAENPAGTKTKPNAPCPCGSGKKHKKCCM